MDFEQRIERLTERHEALAQSVELMRAAAEQDAQNIRSLANIAADALDSIKRLERVATAHENRLDDHDKRLDNLAG